MTTRGEPNVVRLPNEPVREPEPEPSRPGRLHGLSIAGMAVFALIGIAAMITFITVRWPQGTGRYVVMVFVVSGLGFITCASTAVLSAARDTYARQTVEKDEH